MDCRRCDRSIHPQHPGECRDCHKGRGLCRRCYHNAKNHGTLDQYPPLNQRDPVERPCRHGGIHGHGTFQRYDYDDCRCKRCRHARAVKNKQAQLDRMQHGPFVVDATGTARRLRALAAIGWSVSAVAERLSMQPGTLWKIATGSRTRVRRTTAAQVRAVYDTLSMRPRQPVSKAERVSVSKARQIAATQGWVPPLAWNDEEIDDPAATPHIGRDDRSSPGRRIARIEDYKDLRGKGVADWEIARRWGLDDAAMERWLHRAGLFRWDVAA